MFVRSQDKTGLYDIKGTEIYSMFDDEIQLSKWVNHSVTLGRYSSKEKVLKVLDMIQDNIRKVELAKIGGLNCFEIDWIFQMPQDDEVE